MKKSFAFTSLMMALAMSSNDYGMNYGGSKKEPDNSHKCLPYFYFQHDGRKYEIQAINEASAKLKFEKIISRKTSQFQTNY